MIHSDPISKCVEVARRYGAKKLVLFGTAAQDPQNARDIDLLCEGVKGAAFFEMAGMMEHEAHVAVDVIPGVPRTKFVEINERRGKTIHAADETVAIFKKQVLNFRRRPEVGGIYQNPGDRRDVAFC